MGMRMTMTMRMRTRIPRIEANGANVLVLELLLLAPTGALEEGILCVRDIIQITVKMSSSSILKSPGGL